MLQMAGSGSGRKSAQEAGVEAKKKTKQKKNKKTKNKEEAIKVQDQLDRIHVQKLLNTCGLVDT